ncbi:MAG: head GIN domain-containing protein [Pseudomonadota bacterium]
MRRIALPGALTVAVCLALAACTNAGDSGPAVAQERGVDAFHSIELRGAATLDVLVGAQQSVVVEASADTQQRVSTAVRNGKLTVDHKGGGWLWQPPPGELKLRITLPKLNSLTLNGAGKITVNGLDGGATSIVMSGAGEIEASGRLDTLTARINGAGSADLSRVQATDAEVVVNGAGSLSVNATGQLDAKLNGVGSITYEGTPRVLNSAINGVGSIARR